MPNYSLSLPAQKEYNASYLCNGIEAGEQHRSGFDKLSATLMCISWS